MRDKFNIRRSQSYTYDNTGSGRDNGEGHTPTSACLSIGDGKGVIGNTGLFSGFLETDIICLFVCYCDCVVCCVY